MRIQCGVCVLHIGDVQWCTRQQHWCISIGGESWIVECERGQIVQNGLICYSVGNEQRCSRYSDAFGVVTAIGNILVTGTDLHLLLFNRKNEYYLSEYAVNYVQLFNNCELLSK